MNDKWNMAIVSKGKGTNSRQKNTSVDPQKNNCWEIMKCGRESGGERIGELCVCPAAVFTALPDGEYNNGKFLGRRCWRVAGTLCEDKVQGTFARKIENCRQCEFYKLVKEQEGDDFVE